MSVSPSTANCVTLQLHKREQSDGGYWGHPAISTVTFCTGDPQRCVDALRPKVRAVLDANPWIAGALSKRRTLVHPATGSDALVDEILSLQSSAAVNRRARYEDLVKATGGNPALTVQNGSQISKTGARVTKLVVVVEYEPPTPNSSRSSGSREFSLVFSMSHVVADGHDYYKIFNMIAGNAPVEALDPRRVVAYEEREAEWTGPADFGWLASFGLVKGLLSGLLFGPRARWCCYMVDDAKVSAVKARAKATSVGGGEGGGGVSFVSTNDVLTSHFCNATGARVAMMVINMRGKISLPITDHHAGCYEGCLLLDAQNYTDPASVRKSLLGGVPYTRQIQSPPLPGFCGGPCPMAFITSWASFPFQLSLSLDKSGGSGINSQVLHLPCMQMPGMMDVAVVFRPVPGKLAVLYLAKCASSQSLTETGTTVLGASVDDSIFPPQSGR